MRLLACVLLGLSLSSHGSHGSHGSNDAPPSRALSLELTATARVAGTSGSRSAAVQLARLLREAGWQVELDERVVLLSLPRRLAIAIHADSPGDSTGAALSSRVERYDPDAIPPGDVPLFNAWSKSADVRARIVDVGHGLRADYERVQRLGIEVRGAFALARYGKSYRGVKVDLATGYGCAGVLLFSDPDEDGALRGPTWPWGPWKPAHDGQRGSISSMGRSPGDPSTPGWGSPGPGESGTPRRLEGPELDARLPAIPCMPIGADEAMLIRTHLKDGVGPGPAEVALSVDQPRELHTIYNVIAELEGACPGRVLFGNHRDAWVRGAHDAASGTVALLRAAQHLGERRAAGWQPEHTINFCFWDAEESGLIGSTEWGEANADLLRAEGLVYVNADAVVSGTNFDASGTPGLLGALTRALEKVPAPPAPSEGARDESLWQQWSRHRTSQGEDLELVLPGSGSDYTVFLHHIGLPVIDFRFSGNAAGHYHTAYDDFVLMDSRLDPEWIGHETAGRFITELCVELCAAGPRSFDEREAALALARHARLAGGEGPWLGPERAERLARAFESLAAVADGPPRGEAPPGFYASLAAPRGLEGRTWYRNRLWAPGLETGYTSETFPSLRSAAARGGAELERELTHLIEAVAAREALHGPDREP